MPDTSKILIVDDEPRNVKLLEAYLKGEHYQLITAFNGEQALAQAKQELPDVILLDVMMPDISGFEVTQKLKEDAATQSIPIILVTALDGTENRVQGLDIGADEFLTKPVNRHELIARMRSLLKMKHLQDELQNRHAITQKLVKLEKDSVSAETVLLVEDEDYLSQQMELLLYQQGLRVLTAGDIATASQIVDQQQPDIVILDKVLPDGDGIELLKQWKSSPVLTEMPIIILTVVNDLETKIAALEQGADDYLIKHIENGELIARIKASLRRASSRKKLKMDIERLHQGAVTDRLTGLHNRRYFDVDLEHRFAQAKRKPGSSFGLIMVDVDFFKAINDTYGHVQGDRVLTQVAMCLQHSARTSDIVTRYGGEEFCIILPDTSRQGAKAIAERMREAIDTHLFQDIDNSHVTASFGVASFEPDDTQPLQVIERADKALYQAKSTGRNVVCSAEASDV